MATVAIQLQKENRRFFWFKFIIVCVRFCVCPDLRVQVVVCVCVCVHACPADLVCLLYLSLFLFTPEGSWERLHLNTEITAMPDSDKRSQRAAAFSSPHRR